MTLDLSLLFAKSTAGKSAMSVTAELVTARDPRGFCGTDAKASPTGLVDAILIDAMRNPAFCARVRKSLTTASKT